MRMKVMGGITEALLEICTNAFYECQKLVDNGFIILDKNHNFIHLGKLIMLLFNGQNSSD